MSKLTALQEQLRESNEANKALLQNYGILAEQHETLKQMYEKELTTVRIPNKLNPYQFNEITNHLAKMRPEFLKVLEVCEALPIMTEEDRMSNLRANAELP